MEKKFKSADERAGYYCLQYLDTYGAKEKGKVLLEWYKAMLFGFRGFESNAEWQLYDTFVERLYNEYNRELCRHIANTKEIPNKLRELYDWYNASKDAISKEYINQKK